MHLMMVLRGAFFGFVSTQFVVSGYLLGVSIAAVER